MLTACTPDYGDPVPNQPKYPGRHLRMDDPRWEGLGVIGATSTGDRTKEVIAWLDWQLYVPDASPPKRIPPDQLVAELRRAAAEAASEARTETDPRKRSTLERKSSALDELATQVAHRTGQAGHIEDGTSE